MPRNASGIYTLPDSNPVATGEVVTSDWANETMTDIEQEMSASLPRDGSAPMTGKLSLIDGLETAPALRFTKDARTGIYRKADGAVGVTVRGQTTFEFNATGANVPTGKALTIVDAPVTDTSAVNKAYVDSRVGKSVLTIWEYVPTLGATVITGADLNGKVLNYSAISTIVTMNGTVLQPGDDYVLTNANTVTLTAPTLFDDDVVMVVEIAGSAGPVGPMGPMGQPGMTELDGPPLTTYIYLATEGQTVFTGEDSNGQTLAYKTGGLLVFVAGKYAEFAETDAATITLATAAAADDEVVIVEVTRAAGVRGEKGEKGDTGSPGVPGNDSTIPGPTGNTGPAGATGVAGVAGPKGDAGAASTVPGPAGPAGPAGAKGDASTVPGPAGPAGTVGTLVIRPVTATAGQTVFTVAYTATFVFVMMNGALLLPTTDYTATNGTSITLLKAAVVGDVLAVFTI